MRRVRRPPAAITGVREAVAIAANLGRDCRSTRKRRHLTQAELGARVGLGQSEIGYLERGHGARTSIETWVAIGIALDRPVTIGFSRDVVSPLNDAGHLAAQELVAQLAGRARWRVSFEVAANPAAPGLTTDLVLARDDAVVLTEIWNRVDDLGAAARSSDRKVAETRLRVPAASSLWLLVDTAANREVVRRLPAIIRARFRGSSAGWVGALTERDRRVPDAPGIAWIDVRSRRLRELRLVGG